MVMSSVSRSEHAEGSVAKSIEQQTAKLPSDLFLWAAIGSIAASATLHLTGNKNGSVFVGQWAPTFLILGLYRPPLQLGRSGGFWKMEADTMLNGSGAILQPLSDGCQMMPPISCSNSHV
jgi:hypothetical protein